MPALAVRRESWPLAGVFRISRGARSIAETVLVEIRDGDAAGRGECVPYSRYGETVESVIDAIEGLRGMLEAGLTREALGGTMGPGAARNAVDCALWEPRGETFRAAGVGIGPGAVSGARGHRLHPGDRTSRTRWARRPPGTPAARSSRSSSTATG